MKQYLRRIRLFIWVCILFGTAFLPACATNSGERELGRKGLLGGVKYYRVQGGDTLYSIGNRSGHGYKKLARWNNIKSPYKIKIGQKIRLFDPGKTSINATKPQKKTVTAPKQSNKNTNINYKSNSYEGKLKLYWQWPLKGRILKTYKQSGKKGIDIQAKAGQKVRSAATGKVVYSGDGLKGYGNLLIIKHNERYLSAYAHNRRLLVKEGQKVKRGQAIAEVGRNARNQFSLHFEIRKNGNSVNPIDYLPSK